MTFPTLHRMHTLLPGVLLCTVGAAITLVLDWALATVTGGIHAGLLIAVILGMAVGNTVRIPQRFFDGIALTAKKVLKVGVALLGLSIPVGIVIGLGIVPLVTVIAVVTSGLLLTIPIGRKLGLTREQALLIGAGTSICGAAAIGAVEGILTKRKEHEFVTAIAVICLLGTALIALDPLVLTLLGATTKQSGVFVGAGVHEVSQVVAAGHLAGKEVLPIAVTVKLGRVLCLAPALALISYFERKRILANHATTSGQDRSTPKLPPLVPIFVIGFIIFVTIRSLLPVPVAVLEGTDWVRTFFFTAAMFAQGLGVTAATVKAAGHTPFLFGLVLSVVVLAVAGTGAAIA